MSVIIHGMEMPESCEECLYEIIDPTGGASACAATRHIILRKVGEGRPSDCPLEEVMEDDMR